MISIHVQTSRYITVGCDAEQTSQAHSFIRCTQLFLHRAISMGGLADKRADTCWHVYWCRRYVMCNVPSALSRQVTGFILQWAWLTSLDSLKLVGHHSMYRDCSCWLNRAAASHQLLMSSADQCEILMPADDVIARCHHTVGKTLTSIDLA